VTVNPECAAGKHGNCDGLAMCDSSHCDDIHGCECWCHGGDDADEEVLR
jgi:hypothetical protein